MRPICFGRYAFDRNVRVKSTFRETEAFLQTESEDEDSKPMSREKLLEQIRQKKEVIGKLRGQPWSMRRKRRTLKLDARARELPPLNITYAFQTSTTLSAASRIQSFQITLIQRRDHKEMESFHSLAQKCPDLFDTVGSEDKENRKFVASRRLISKKFCSIRHVRFTAGHFGSVVSSYFTFLRWVLGVNVTMTFIIIMFVTIPEVARQSHCLIRSAKSLAYSFRCYPMLALARRVTTRPIRAR